MSMSYTANMRCISPLDALPVPFVGSNPLPSVGRSTVSVPPGRAGSATVPGAVVVVCNWFCGFGRVVVAARTLVLVFGLVAGLVVVVDRDCPGAAVVLVVFSSARTVVV